MMKRKLTKIETDLTTKGIEQRKSRILDMEEELGYLNDFDKFNKKWKDYQDKKEKQTKEEKIKIIGSTIQHLKEQIESEKNVIKEQSNQLKDGVEVRAKQKMTGVD